MEFVCRDVVVVVVESLLLLAKSSNQMLNQFALGSIPNEGAYTLGLGLAFCQTASGAGRARSVLGHVWLKA